MKKLHNIKSGECGTYSTTLFSFPPNLDYRNSCVGWHSVQCLP